MDKVAQERKDPPSERIPFEWEVGQHIGLIGETGSGKTTLAQALLQTRRYVMAFRAKPDDTKWVGYTKLRRALPQIDSPANRRILLEPRYEDQWQEFSIALDRAFRQGNWTVFIDDLPNVQDLGEPIFTVHGPNMIKRLLTMGRSLKVSMVTAMQRPVDITRYALSEVRLTASFMVEGRDLDTLRKSSSDFFAEVCEELSGHQFAIYHRESRMVWVGQLNLQESGKPPLFDGQYFEPPKKERVYLDRSG